MDKKDSKKMKKSLDEHKKISKKMNDERKNFEKSIIKLDKLVDKEISSGNYEEIEKLEKNIKKIKILKKANINYILASYIDNSPEEKEIAKSLSLNESNMILLKEYKNKLETIANETISFESPLRINLKKTLHEKEFKENKELCKIEKLISKFKFDKQINYNYIFSSYILNSMQKEELQYLFQLTDDDINNLQKYKLEVENVIKNKSVDDLINEIDNKINNV